MPFKMKLEIPDAISQITKRNRGKKKKKKILSAP
jgi:hypothetical protein